MKWNVSLVAERPLNVSQTYDCSDHFDEFNAVVAHFNIPSSLDWFDSIWISSASLFDNELGATAKKQMVFVENRPSSCFPLANFNSIRIFTEYGQQQIIA